MKLYLKNMVCNRCITAVENILQEHNLHQTSVQLGEVEIEEQSLTDVQRGTLQKAAQDLGFEIIDDSKSKLIEVIKREVIKLVHSDEKSPLKLSAYLAGQLGQDYRYLSRLFSEVEGITIEHYVIAQRIERVKELLVYGEQTLADIAFQMDYSSTAHLSRQFRQITGMTPTEFKSLRTKPRIPLDAVGKAK